MSFLVAARFLHFAAAMIAFGGVGFDFVLRAVPAIDAGAQFSRRLASLVRWSAIVALLSAVVWLMCETGEMAGDLRDAFDPGTVWLVLTGTSFGEVWLGRLVVGVALVAVLLVRRDTFSVAHLVLAGVLVASLGLVGHATVGDASAGLFHRVNHGVHLLAAGAWVGALVALVLLLFSGGKQTVAHDAAQRFSTIGYAVVALVLASGTINSWFLLRSASDLLSTDYGRLLFAKILLVAAMIAAAAFHRVFVLPRLQRSAWSTVRFGRSVVVEIALAAAVLAAASFLGISPPQM